MKNESRHIDTLKKHFHPALRSIPELATDTPEFLAMAAGFKKCGFIQPLLIDERGLILDDHSRNLLNLALRWQLTEVPVKVCQAEDAEMLALHSLLHRRHLTKSALAYLAVPLLLPAFKAAHEKMLRSLAKDQQIPGVHSVDSQSKNADELAEEIGISRAFLFEARKVHELFTDKKVYSFNVQGGAQDGTVRECTLKEWFEPRILRAPIGGEHEQNRPLGLGGVIAGIASVREGDKGKFSPKQTGQMELALGGFATMTHRMLKLPAASMLKSIKDFYAQNGEKFSEEQLDQLEEMGEAIKAQAKQLRKAKA